MKVTLTGATGFIGSHVLSELQEHGHSVTALVRDAPHADTVADRGVTATVVDLYDRAVVGRHPARCGRSDPHGESRRRHERRPGFRGGRRGDRGVRRHPTVAELTEAAAVAAGAPGAVPGSDDEAKTRLGDYFAEVLLLDQGTVAAKARAELAWAPSHPGLPEEFRDGSYRKLTTG